MTTTTTWIVAYDFSEHARTALNVAADMLSRQGGGRLVVVHAHPLGTGSDGVSVDLGTLVATADLDRAYMDDATRQLDEELKGLDVPGVTCEHRVIPGRPAIIVTDVAAAEGASLIVVGSHGRRGLERMFLGSVAEAILRKARGAVLVVKPKA